MARASGLALAALTIAAVLPLRALADEGGVSFWLPGTYGSLAAVPGLPGWSFATFNYYNSVSASKGAEFVRGGGIEAGLNSHPDLQFVVPNYAFATPVFGGQLNLSLMVLFGNNPVSVDGTLIGPGGRTLSGSRSKSAFGAGDLYPSAADQMESGRQQLHDLFDRRHSGRPL